MREIFETWFEITYDIQDNYVDFEVNFIISRDMDDVILEKEKYIRGTIKWDGCSHVNFGDKGDDGYLHLCGKQYWVLHNKLMEHIYDVATKNMKNYDKDVAE